MSGIMRHWAYWAIVAGLGLDLIDCMTRKAGSTDGMIYGAGGLLASFNSSIPCNITPGEVLAMVGAAGLVFHKGR